MTTGITSTHIELDGNSSDPSTPASDKTLLYAKDDNYLYIMGDDGTPRMISGDAFVLNDLDNVVITSPTTGQGLQYDGSNWLNVATPIYPQVLDDVNDVNGVVLADTQTIVSFDGTSFVNSKNKYGYYEKTGGSTGVSLAQSFESLTDQIVYATPDVDRESGGDGELLDTYFYKPRSDAVVDDYGTYRMDAWFRFEHVAIGSPEGDPTGTIAINFAQITGLSIDFQTTVALVNILTDDPYFVNVTYTFNAANSAGKDYIFFVNKSNSEPYVMWHHTMIKKISHSISS